MLIHLPTFYQHNSGLLSELCSNQIFSEYRWRNRDEKRWIDYKNPLKADDQNQNELNQMVCIFWNKMFIPLPCSDSVMQTGP